PESTPESAPESTPESAETTAKSTSITDVDVKNGKKAVTVLPKTDANSPGDSIVLSLLGTLLGIVGIAFKSRKNK
ncbi:hypothetical protein, partial [Leuconostoc mesenteroides]